jgi:hypothetical protein
MRDSIHEPSSQENENTDPLQGNIAHSAKRSKQFADFRPGDSDTSSTSRTDRAGNSWHRLGNKAVVNEMRRFLFPRADLASEQA